MPSSFSNVRHCLLSYDFSLFLYLYTLFDLSNIELFPHLITLEENPVALMRTPCPWVTLMCGGVCVVLLMHSCSTNVLQLPLLQLRSFLQFTVTWLDPLRFFPYCKHCICAEWLTATYLLRRSVVYVSSQRFIWDSWSVLLWRQLLTLITTVRYCTDSMFFSSASTSSVLPKKKEKTAHWAELKSTLGFCQATGNLEGSPIKWPSFTLCSSITLLTWSIEPNKAATQ